MKRVVKVSENLVYAAPSLIQANYRWNREWICGCPGLGQVQKEGRLPPWKVCIHCGHVLMFELRERYTAKKKNVKYDVLTNILPKSQRKKDKKKRDYEAGALVQLPG